MRLWLRTSPRRRCRPTLGSRPRWCAPPPWVGIADGDVLLQAFIREIKEVVLRMGPNFSPTVLTELGTLLRFAVPFGTFLGTG
jgi:hypothetical protein